MKIPFLLFISASFSFGQTLPYQIDYKNQNGWPERMVFERSPENPNIIIGSIYSYVDAKLPFYTIKSSEVCNTEKALAYVARMQEKDLAIARTNEAIAQGNADSDAAVARVVAHERSKAEPDPEPEPTNDRGSEAEARRSFEETKQRHLREDTERRIEELEKKLHDK